jgi:HEAT repeat protein
VEPRKRQRLLLGTILIGAIVIGCVLFFSGNSEPTYNGRPLSEWVVIAARMSPSPYTQSEKEAATEAIQAIGTNALPHLVEWLGYEPKGLRRVLFLNFRKVPNRFQTNPAVYYVAYRPVIRVLGAEESFSILGPSAAPAIPALTQMLRSTNSSNGTRQRALSALAFIGPDAFPTVLGVVSNISQLSDLSITMGPLTRLKRHEFDKMLPALLPHLQSTNLPLALQVINYLGNMWSDSELVVPAYTRCLEDPRWEIRAAAASSLRPLGWSRAQAALPALVKALGDTNATVRSNAAAAIRMINPGALPEEFHE